MFSNMKILTPNSQQNVSLSSPTLSQQTQLVQTGGGVNGVGSSSKEFTNSHGGSTQKSSSKREQHQKHNGGPNKSKFANGNGGNNSNKMQQYHHNSSSGGNKNKKQHYNGNNNSTSSLNRKKFYQQQNALQQLHYHHHHNITTATSTANNNNNCHLVKNQNFTGMDLMQNPMGNKNINTIPNSDSSMSSTISTETCNCSIQNNDCDNLTLPSPEYEYRQQHLHNTSTDTLQRSTTIASSQNSTSVPETDTVAAAGGCKCYLKFTKISQSTVKVTTAANMKANKNKKVSIPTDSIGTNRQYFFETEPPTSCKCNCVGYNSTPSSSAVHQSANNSLSTTASQSKRKSWKNSNNSCCGGGGGSCEPPCSVSPKLSNDAIFADKFGTKRCECNCNCLPFNSSTVGSDSCNKSQRKQPQGKESLPPTTAMTTSTSSSNGSTSARSASNNTTTPSVGDISCSSSTEHSFITSSPTTKQKYTNSSIVNISQLKSIETGTKLATETITNGGGSNSSCADSNQNRTTESKTSSRSSASGLSSPSSYSLDFLHSVGVQMTGGVKLDVTSNVGNNMRPITAGTSSYGSQTSAESSPARGPYPYSAISINQRQQQRYMFGGGGNQQHPYQQQHHHHQPTQLTIASFLQKDILGESLLSSSNASSGANATTNSNHSSSGASNNYNDQQVNQQQHYARPHQQARYYSNYYQTPHYHQQTPGHLHSCGYSGNTGTTAADLSRFTANTGSQRPHAYSGGYLNYHHAGSNNAYHNQIQQNQEPSRTRIAPSGGGGGGCDTNSTISKKSSHGSCSSTSSCSSSSSSSTASVSSSSSCGSHRKQQQNELPQPQQQLSSSSLHTQQKQLSSLNLAIETLPSKSSNQQGGSQRQGHHRGHHNHHGHGHHHHHHQNHYGHHHHHQHVLANTPTTPQHQNYYNLTYVSTDGNSGGSTNASINGTNSRGCSPAPVLPPTPSSSNPSPKSLENCSGPCPGPVAMMANLQLTTASGQLNYSRYPQNQNSVAQQFQHFQQQQFLNKKLLAPLTLSVPSPSPSPTPSHIGGTLPPQAANLGPGPVPHNIICCSQLDEASTAAAAAAAKSGIIAGNDYDSDASSTHSSSVSNVAQPRKYQTFKSLSISSSSSATSLCQLECKSQPGTPADVSTSTTPLGSPMGYSSYGSSAFPHLQASSTGGTQQHYLNQPQLVSKAVTGTQLPHVYHNGVISLLNLPTQSPANSCEGNCTNYMEDDYQQQQQQRQLQPPHFFLTSSSAQSSAEPLNIVSALSASTSRSNSSSGYWSPSHQCNFLYHQLSSSSSSSGPTTTSLIVPPHTPSCGSSSSSISPSLPDRDEHNLQQPQQQLHKQFSSSGSSSPSTCSSCLNEQLGISEGCSSTNSTSSNSSLNGRGNTFVASSERGSTQLLTQQQQRLIAQQTQHPCSPSLPLSSNNTSSSIPSAQRARSTGNGRNNQYLQNHSLMTSSSISTNNNAPQTVLPHIFTHQQLQSLPPPPPPHNLLYNNPQGHHLRTLGNSSVHDFFTHTPPDRFLARAHLIEAKEAPSSLLNNSKWDSLSQDIWRKFIHSQQTEETFKQKMRLWRYLYLFIKNAYPRYGLYLVGSTISGFGSDTSDVDMCLVSRSASNIDPRMEALFNLTVLRDCLGKSGEFEYFNLIEAKVPILRFRDRVHQLEVDLNFNNCVGIKNTHLLYCYSQLDWRLRPLVLVTKLWAQHHNINNAKNMTISSYSLVLMVIHFLQYAVTPPVLPCLHELFPEKFPLLRSNDFGYVDMNETIGPHESKNSQTVGELFLKFLEYYSNFDFSQNAISVRTGGTLPINVCRTAKSLKNDIHQWKELCIEEPFDLTNTARSVYDYETFERVKSVFVSSWQVLKESLDLNSVFMPVIIDTSTSQTSSISDGDHSVRADSANMPPEVNAENRTLSWADDLHVIDSSNSCSSTKQMVKYRESKHIQANCHKELLYETKVSACRDIPKPAPPTFTSSTPSSGHSSSTAFSGKQFNRNNNSTAALIS